MLEASAPLGGGVAVADALGRVLAEDVRAAHDVPPFANSAMDGFAVRAGEAGRTLRVVGESRAGAPARWRSARARPCGSRPGRRCPRGRRRRPERSSATATRSTCATASPPGDNVRGRARTCAPARSCSRGTRLGPAELGVAVGAGRAAMRCARRPRVAIVATGDELVDARRAARPGQIHDSNALSLAALARARRRAVVLGAPRARRRAAHRAALGAALDEADLVLVSGGVSVGPHDHVKPALAELGVEERFWRVALRPGKPTWFGTRGETLVLGLPGNPVSALVTFVLFARPALAALQGAAPPRRRRARAGPAAPRHPDRDEWSACGSTTAGAPFHGPPGLPRALLDARRRRPRARSARRRGVRGRDAGRADRRSDDRPSRRATVRRARSLPRATPYRSPR